MAMKWILVFLVHVSVAVSSEVFRLVGSSAQLDIQNHRNNFEDITWVFNTNKTVVKYYNINEFKKLIIYSPYEGRVEFNNKSYSLTLKNLQKSDSGQYKAKTSGAHESIVAVYSLSVLDPVETPVFTAVPDQQSSDSCNITLTCEGLDLSVNSICFNETCEEKEMKSPEGTTLSLSVRDSSSIICNISNPVSWNMSVIEVKQHCRSKDADDHNVHIGSRWKGILFSIAGGFVGIIVIAAIILCLKKQRKAKSKDQQQSETLYAQVQNGNGGPAVTLDTLESPSTVYSMVGRPAQPSETKDCSGTTINTSYQEPEPQMNLKVTSTDDISCEVEESVKQEPLERPRTTPETIYATVDKTNK